MNYLDIFESFTQKVIDNTNNTTQEEKRINTLGPKEIIITKIDNFINNIVVPRMTYGVSDEYDLPAYIGKKTNKDTGLPYYEFESDDLTIINKYGDDDVAYFGIFVTCIDDEKIYININIGYNHCISNNYECEINEFLDDPDEYMMNMIDDSISYIDYYDDNND